MTDTNDGQINHMDTEELSLTQEIMRLKAEHEKEIREIKSKYTKDRPCTLCKAPDHFSDETICHKCIEKWKICLISKERQQLKEKIKNLMKNKVNHWEYERAIKDALALFDNHGRDILIRESPRSNGSEKLNKKDTGTDAEGLLSHEGSKSGTSKQPSVPSNSLGGATVAREPHALQTGKFDSSPSDDSNTKEAKKND